jgi:alanine dehydrogenase
VSIVVGLPRMIHEPGERRDFLPDFVEAIARAGASSIVLERGYGSGMGIEEHLYHHISSRVKFGSHEDCFSADAVLVVRCPPVADLERLREGALLVTMLHFRTHPARTQRLIERGVRAVSLDSLTDDSGARRVEYMQGVAWNGTAAAFRSMASQRSDFSSPAREALHVLVLGAGAVGTNAMQAAIRYGDVALRSRLHDAGVPGVEVTVVDYDLTGRPEYMQDRLGWAGLLVDATQRGDATVPVIPNSWIAAMPEDAVILDLSADGYDFSFDPPLVKGIEGIPEGTLEHYLFYRDDVAYAALDPRVRTENRRTALSCYAWPGIHPFPCMKRYGEQLRPFVPLLLGKDASRWDTHADDPEERSLARAEVTRWMQTAQSE